MSETNGQATSATTLPPMPEGAVLLSEEVFERTSKEWVKLPFLSLRVAKMTTAQLVERGYVKPVAAWAAYEADRVRTAWAVEHPDGCLLEHPDHAACGNPSDHSIPTDAELLDLRAAEVRTLGVWVQIGIVGFSEVLALQPPIPGSDLWPVEAEARAERFTKWYTSLPEAQQKQYLGELLESQYKIIAAGMLQPALRPEQVRRFKDDALYLANQIARLSGFDQSPKPSALEKKKDAGPQPVAAQEPDGQSG